MSDLKMFAYKWKTRNINRCKILAFPLIALVLPLFASGIACLNVYSKMLALVLGVVGLFLIPGLCIISLLKKMDSPIFDNIDANTLGMILGFALQMINVLVLYSVSVFSIFYKLEFGLSLSLMTFVECLGLQLVNYLKPYSNKSLISRDWKKKLTAIALLLFVTAFMVRLYYQTQIQGFSSDGATYLDQARSIVLSGNFTSKVINDGTAYPFANQLGFSGHSGAYFGIAIFFGFLDVSLSSAQFMTVFLGSLIVVLIFWLTYLFSKNRIAAIIAGGIATFHPLLLATSSLIQGPEAISAVFALTCIILFVTFLEKRNTILIVLLGTSLFLASLAWTQDFYVLMIGIIFVAFAFLLYHKAKHGIDLIEFLSLAFCCLSIILTLRLGIYPTIYLSLTCAFWASFMLSRRLAWTPSKKISNALLLGSVTLTLFLIYNLRSYAYPQVNITVAPSIGERLVTALPASNFLSFNTFNAYFQYLGINAGEVLLCLSIFSIGLIWIKRQIFIPLALLGIYVFFAIFSYPIFTFADGFRLFIVPSALVIISGATLIAFLAEKALNLFSSLTDLNKHRFIKNVSLVMVVLVVIVLLSSTFTASYSNYSHAINYSINIKYTAGWSDDFIAWIRTNTKPDDVLASRKPAELAWLTGRTVVGILRYGIPMSELNFSDIIEIVRNFHVKYLIVDKPFVDSYPNLLDLAYPQSPIPGFTIVYSTTYAGLEVRVYAVSL